MASVVLVGVGVAAAAFLVCLPHFAQDFFLYRSGSNTSHRVAPVSSPFGDRAVPLLAHWVERITRVDLNPR